MSLEMLELVLEGVEELRSGRSLGYHED